MAKRTPPFPFGNIQHVSMVVEDLQKTVRFYEILFGFVVEKQMGNSELGVRAVVLQKQGRRIELFEYRDDHPEHAKRKGLVRGNKTAERFQPGIRGIAFRTRDMNEGTKIARQSSYTSRALEPTACPATSKKKNVKPVALRDPNGIPLRPLGKGRRQPSASAEARDPRPRPSSRKRKMKQ